MVHQRPFWVRILVFLASLQVMANSACAQEAVPSPTLRQVTQTAPNPTLATAKPLATDTPLPINLPTALQLANAAPLDIALASERIAAAAAQLERANVLRL